MNKVIYLESDEEITNVVEKMREASERGIVLVFPKGSALSQSIINLKLLKRAAEDMLKGIAIVTTDKVSKNLAEQVGILVSANAKEASLLEIAPEDVPVEEEEAEEIAAKNYRSYDLSKLNSDEDNDNEANQDKMGSGQEAKGIDKFEDMTSDSLDYESSGDDSDNSEESTENIEEDIIADDSEEGSDEGEFTRKKIKVEISNDEEYNQPNDKMKPKMSSRKKKIIIGTVVALVVLVLAGSFVVLPRAETSIVLNTEDYKNEFEVTVDKDKTSVDLASKTIPGKLVQTDKDEQKEFASTGQRDAGEKATGTVTVYNNLAKQIAVDKNTKFTKDGQVFYSTESVFVPVATMTVKTDADGKAIGIATTPGKIDVKVIAAASGEAYNLAANSTLTVSGRSSTDVYAKNAAALAGGSTRIIKYVTEEDLTKAEAEVKETITDSGKQALADEATTQGLKIFDKNIDVEILSVENSKKANEEAESFTMKLRATVQTLGFSEDDFRNLGSNTVNTEIGSDEMIVDSEQTSLTYQLSEDNGSSLKLKASFDGKIGKKIDQASLAKEVTFKSEAKALDKIKSINGVSDATIRIYPSFLKYTPVLKNRIKIIFDYQR